MCPCYRKIWQGNDASADNSYNVSCRELCFYVYFSCIRVFSSSCLPWLSRLNCSRLLSPPELCLSPILLLLYSVSMSAPSSGFSILVLHDSNSNNRNGNNFTIVIVSASNSWTFTQPQNLRFAFPSFSFVRTSSFLSTPATPHIKSRLHSICTNISAFAITYTVNSSTIFATKPSSLLHTIDCKNVDTYKA